MAQLKHITALDETVTLYLLGQCELTHKQVWETLTRLTNGEVKYTSNHIAGILYALRRDKYVQQYQESKQRILYSLTEAGQEELKKRLSLYGIYENILHGMADRDDLPKISFVTAADYEKSFDSFLERSEYDNAENILFVLVRSAFKAGWCSAGGEPPMSNPILQLVDRTEKRE